MVRLSSHVSVTVTGSPVKALTVPSGSVAELLQLVVVNRAASAALVELRSGDGSDTDYDYTIMKIIVPAGGQVALNKRDLEGLRSAKDIYVVTDQQPLDVTIVVDAR